MRHLLQMVCVVNFALNSYLLLPAPAFPLPPSAQLPSSLPTPFLPPSSLPASLHAPNQELREALVPSAKAYPVEALLADCRHYFEVTGRRVSFEYTLLGEWWRSWVSAAAE